MLYTLAKSWWLLALCGALEAIISVTYLDMRGTAGPLNFHAWNGTVVFLGKLALAAGAGEIAAGILRSTKGKCWPLVLNGLALCALGLIECGFVRFPISFLTIALLILVMALTIGVLAWIIARTLRHVADVWFLALAGAASVGFAVAFLALAFGWTRMERGAHTDLLWLGSYFGFNAICMLALAVRLPRIQGFSQPGLSDPDPSLAMGQLP